MLPLDGSWLDYAIGQRVYRSVEECEIFAPDVRFSEPGLLNLPIRSFFQMRAQSATDCKRKYGTSNDPTYKHQYCETADLTNSRVKALPRSRPSVAYRSLQ